MNFCFLSNARRIVIVSRFGILPSQSFVLLHQQVFFSSVQYKLLVKKVRLAKGVKERGLQKGENSRGTPLVVSTFCLTKAEMPMKHGSGHESGISKHLFPFTSKMSVSQFQAVDNISSFTLISPKELSRKSRCDISKNNVNNPGLS